MSGSTMTQLPLLAAARKHATAILRHTYRSARHLSLLTGLLASLLSGKGLSCEDFELPARFTSPCRISRAPS